LFPIGFQTSIRHYQLTKEQAIRKAVHEANEGPAWEELLNPMLKDFVWSDATPWYQQMARLAE